MLVLKRRTGETLTIDTGNGTVTVKVIRIDGQQVHLGIAAPAAMAILRDDALDTTPKHTQEPAHGTRR